MVYLEICDPRGRERNLYFEFKVFEKLDRLSTVGLCIFYCRQCKEGFLCVHFFFSLRVLISAVLFQINSFIINMKKSIGSIYSFSLYYKKIFDFRNKNKEVSLMLLHVGRMSQLYLGYNQMCLQ